MFEGTLGSCVFILDCVELGLEAEVDGRGADKEEAGDEVEEELIEEADKVYVEVSVGSSFSTNSTG